MAKKRRRFTPEFTAPLTHEPALERESLKAIVTRHKVRWLQVGARKRQSHEAVQAPGREPRFAEL